MRLLFSLLLISFSSFPVSRSHNITNSTGLATPAAANATAPSPAQVNLTTLMSKNGCKLFADILAGAGDAEKTFEANVGSGLTVFCPVDAATKAFMPKYKNLTGDDKVSLLLYHGIPVYSSMQMLASGNGVVNTLATDGTNKDFNFTVQNEGEAVTLMTGSGGKATITGTLIDRDPLAVYTIDEVLEPVELFKPALAPAPAPAPAAEAPAAENAESSPPAPTPAGTEAKAANHKPADDNVGARACVGRWAVVAVMSVVVMAV